MNRYFFNCRKPGVFFVLIFILMFSVRADDYLLVSRTITDTNFTYTASPTDWRDINIYQLFTDRFYDGNSSNNTTGALDINRDGWFVDGHDYPESKNYHHGGDWAGLKQKLDYLDNMGVNAIWISGVQMNAQGRDSRFTPYHQYHPTDFWRCDPVSGTFQELTDLIDDCHSRGIYVVLDVVINHMADLAGLPYNNDDQQYWPSGNETYTWWGSGRHRGAFNRLDWFHHNGTIINWDTSPENLLGQFKGTDDLATEREDVQNELDLAFKNLISATDCDGFRVDAIKHVEYNWCKQWADDMRKHAASLGKNDFLLFGELFSYDNGALASYCADNNYSFNSALFFPMSSTIKSVFKDNGGTGQLTSQRNNISQYGEGADRLVAFIDNHDVNRISLEMGGDTNDDVAKLKPAMTFLYTAMPVPLLYYGTEHCFDQGGHYNGVNGEEDNDHQRECMFDRGFQPGPANGNKFDGGPSALYSHIAAINEARKSYKSLTRGSFAERWQEGSAGAYAYLRKYNDEEALVALNTSYDSRSIAPGVDKPDGTVFVNALNESETVTVSGGTLSFSLAGKDSKIFVAGNALRIDNAYQWPLDGDVDSADDLWINAEALPVGSSTNAYVVYSTDGGTNWTDVPMTVDGSVTNADGWHVNLGSFPGATVIEYAICVQGDGGEVWANNNNNNYSVTVNADPSVVEWTPAVPSNCFGSTVDVVYSPGDGVLRDATAVQLVYGFFLATATNWSNMAMAAADSNWTATVSIPVGCLKIEICFTDGEGIWDNNDSQNWEIALNDCTGDDSDGDSIPDSWETKYNFSITNAADAAIDSDGDGVVNSNEYIAGTNPREGSSVLALQHSIITGGLSRISWPVADIGRRYTLLRSTNLLDAAFEVVQSNIVGTLPFAEVTDSSSTGETSCFYKLRAEVPGVETPVPVEWTGQVATDPAAGSWDAGESISVTFETAPVGAAVSADIVYSIDGGSNWSGDPLTQTGSNASNDIWSITLPAQSQGTTLEFALAATDSTGAQTWNNNNSANYSVTVNSDFAPASNKPYFTNPTLGTYRSAGITIDGSNTSGEWSDDMLIALDVANDDPRSLGDNWTLHEAPLDFSHLWACWDDDNLYIAWQMVDVTDVIDPANAGSGDPVSGNDGILVWMMLDTESGGSTNDMWDKSMTWNGPDTPDYQIYMAGSLWQSYISHQSGGVFPVDEGEYYTCTDRGIQIQNSGSFAASTLWGVRDCDDRNNGEGALEDFMTTGHSNTSRDSFYEMKIPLTVIGLTKADLEADGIGIMVGSGSDSALDTIPNDPATTDTLGVETYNSSFEWSDSDSFTVPFARVAVQ